MSTQARIGIGVSIYKHQLALYYNTATKIFEGDFLLDIHNDNGDVELWHFNIKLSGKLFVFDFHAPAGPVTVSIKHIAQQLFGKDNDAINNFPDIKFAFTRFFFVYLKNEQEEKANLRAASEQKNRYAAGIELAFDGIEFDSHLSTSVVKFEGSHLKLEKILLCYASKELKVKEQKKDVQRLIQHIQKEKSEQVGGDDKLEDPLKALLEALNISGLSKGFSMGARVKEGKDKYHVIAPMKKPPKSTSQVGAQLTILADDPSKKKKSLAFEKWVKMDKSIGPVTLQGIGVRFDGKTSQVTLLLDAYMKAAKLEISLMEFGLAIDLKNDFKTKLVLNGLGLGFSAGSFAIAGAFKRLGPGNFIGMLSLKYKNLNILGIGGYHKLADFASVFGYLVLKYPLGGPVEFFVNGLAVGFGYHRDLVLPEIDGVNNFPLVQWAIGTKQPKDDKEKSDLENFSETVNEIQNTIPVKQGQYWLALGVKFNSFKLIDGFLLLTVSFGNRLEIALLGTADLQIPKEADKPIIDIGIVLKARFAPDEGVFSLEAALTKNSYVLNKNCHLSGGLAYYLWFAKEHKGDFVISLGGYHPDFKKPKHFPSIKRVGLNWRISSWVQVSGEGYYAITPSYMMAGLSTKAIISMGSIHVNFWLSADFLIKWAPFHYDARLGAGLSVKYSKKIWKVRVHFSFGLRAQLQVSGPEFHGWAKIKHPIINFTINFGQSSSPKAQSWGDVKKQFLTVTHTDEKTKKKTQKVEVLNIAPIEGLHKAPEKQSANANAEPESWIMDPEHFNIKIKTAIPIKTTSTVIPIHDDAQALFLKKTKGRYHYQAASHEGIGIRLIKVHNKDLGSDFNIEVEHLSSQGKKDWSKHFVAHEELSNLPSSLWGQPLSKEDINTAATVKDTLTGFQLKPVPQPSTETWGVPLPGGFGHAGDQQMIDLKNPNLKLKNYTNPNKDQLFKQGVQQQSTRNQTFKVLQDAHLFISDKNAALKIDTLNYEELHEQRYTAPLICATGNDQQDFE